MSHGRGEGREVRITLCGAAVQMRTVASGANFSQLRALHTACAPGTLCPNSRWSCFMVASAVVF